MLDQDEVTHVLFMDDDIDLDARHLITTTAFLSYSTAPVGRRWPHAGPVPSQCPLRGRQHNLTGQPALRPNHHNLDLNQLTSLSALSRAQPAHFNGWWFAAIPLSCFKDQGLPAPIFIRGDDVEFGVRLHRAGIDTVALAPGVGVARAVLCQGAGMATILRSQKSPDPGEFQ